MENRNIPKPEKQHGLLLPRWVVPLVWGIIILFIQVLLPWMISKIGPAFGWHHGIPSWWNFAGLILVAAGIGYYIWCLVFHFRTYQSSVRLGFSPPQLVTDGPYTISRNPMYVSALFGWLGWVIFFGSPAVLVALVLLGSMFAYRVIPQEERQLEGLFGEDYAEYKRSVRRWFGRF